VAASDANAVSALDRMNDMGLMTILAKFRFFTAASSFSIVSPTD
jgi:hypothetical protein